MFDPIPDIFQKKIGKNWKMPTSGTTELYPESVFSVGIRSVFLGKYHTDTEGKLGRYISVSKRGQCPPFSSKGGQWPPFWEAQPPFGKKGGGKGGSIQKRGERYRPKYRKSSKSDTGKIPIPKKLLVTPRYTTLRFSVFLEYFWRKNRLRVLNFSEGIFLHGRLLVIL